MVFKFTSNSESDVIANNFRSDLSLANVDTAVVDLRILDVETAAIDCGAVGEDSVVFEPADLDWCLELIYDYFFI